MVSLGFNDHVFLTGYSSPWYDIDSTNHKCSISGFEVSVSLSFSMYLLSQGSPHQERRRREKGQRCDVTAPISVNRIRYLTETVMWSEPQV